jgi:hypothetical protein
MRIFLVSFLHTGLSFCEAANRLSLKWLKRGAEVAWVEEGHMTLLHIIPHRAGLSRDPLFTSFLVQHI